MREARDVAKRVRLHERGRLVDRGARTFKPPPASAPTFEAWAKEERDEPDPADRRAGVVQLGHHADGTPIRWTFTEITADSFRWTGEALDTDGKTWRLQGDFRARRQR